MVATARTWRAAATMGFALTLGGCATLVTEVDGPTALEGHHLDDAVGLFGRFDERAARGDKTFYIWRRTAEVDGRNLGCELRVEVGYRDQIRESELEGFPAVCHMFSVRYTASSDPRLRSGDEAGADVADRGPDGGRTLKPGTGCPGCRPVGGTVATAAR